MQMSYHGLVLEPVRDVIFDTRVDDLWAAVHRTSNRTVVILTTKRPDDITLALAKLRDWSAVDEWDETDADLVDFVARFPGEASLPAYSDWETVVPYGDNWPFDA